MLAVFFVNSLSDAGVGSLREAITLANGDAVADTIEFSVTGTIDLASQLPTISEALTITGPGQTLLTIDAGGGATSANFDVYRIFEIDGSGGLIDVEISGLTLTGGDQASNGGAILTSENLTLTDSTIIDNIAFRGGAIYNAAGTTTIERSRLTGNVGFSKGGAIYSAGTTNIDSSTIDDNHATYGGAAYNTSGSSITLNSSTISGNFAENGGGAIDNYGTVNLSHSTVTGNGTYLFGGGIRFGTTTLSHTIVSGNEAQGSPSNLYSGSFTGDFNLIGSDATVAGTGNVVSDDPGLLTLANNGGPTPTHALLAGSAAIDAGDPTFTGPPSNDQRGAPFVRVFDDPGASGAGVDIGAYERQTLPPSLSDVTTTADELDYSNADVSLREAINSANLSEGADTITFSSMFLTPQSILLDSQLPTIIEGLTITGPGQTLLTIDAQLGGDGIANGNGWRIFHFDDGDNGQEIDVTLSGVTLTGGDTSDPGGAIFNVENLTITNSTIRDNSAQAGGGVFNFGGDMIVTNSTIAGNSVSTSGGGGINNTNKSLQVGNTTRTTTAPLQAIRLAVAAGSSITE